MTDTPKRPPDAITRAARDYEEIARATVRTPGAAFRMCVGQAVAWLRSARTLKLGEQGTRQRRAVAYHVYRARVNARAARYLSCVS